MRKLKSWVPWWLRIVLKIIFSRLPVDYALWRRLNLFRHGDMNQPLRSLENFLEHANTAGLIGERDGVPFLKTESTEFAVLELGPGDSLFSSVIARSLGASSSWLVDAGNYAKHSASEYQDLFETLSSNGISFNASDVQRTDDAILSHCGGQYLTDGTKSLQTLTDESIDYCYSNAVLEHIPKNEIERVAHELFRIMKMGGVGVHRVDLKDHLGGGLNNLRVANKLWESPLFSQSGFYTNRVRFTEMVDYFKRAGFDCEITKTLTWEILPTARNVIHSEFQYHSDEELLINCFDLLIRKN